MFSIRYVSLILILAEHNKKYLNNLLIIPINCSQNAHYFLFNDTLEQ